MTKNLILLLFAIISSITLYAQQEAMYTHYMYNTLSVNPAYAGSRNALTITGLNRSQWVGFEGAPTTQTLTLHSPVLGEAVNLGVSFIHDAIGPVNNSALFIDYAFRVKLTEKSKLAFGLKLGFNNYKFNLSELNIDDVSDAMFNQNESSFSPNVGLGIYYSRDRFYAGISTPKLFENTYLYDETTNGTNLSIEKLHYYLILGGVIPLSDVLKLKPTSFVKVTKGAPIEADFTASFLIQDKFILGAMYRTGDAVGALAGMNITDFFFVGYSFDWSFVNNTAKYNAGSHELVLRYDFIYQVNKRVRSPRYF